MATTSLLRPGDVVGGYRVEDLIGVGGMATVYRAQQVSLGRPVALKVLARQLTEDETFRERFRREGRHAASLEHPNIVPVYDSGEDGGLLYLAMRLVEGISLADVLAGDGVSAAQAIEILGPIASALDCAHAAGLIHRDVKPQNILISQKGHPYLADFGVAKGSNASGLTATGGFVGSVNYASPEQIAGRELTAASDIYALTAVLYHCLSGQVPYPRESEAGVMHAHLHEPPPPLPEMLGAGDELRDVIARGMAKEPSDRYERAGALIDDAAACLERLPEQERKAIPAFPARGPAGISDPTTDPLRTGERRAVGSETEVDARRAGRGSGDDSGGAASKRPAPLAAVGRRLRGLRAPRGRVAWIAMAGLAVVAVAVALALNLGGEESSTQTARSEAVALRFEEPWRQVGRSSATAPAGLRFRAPVSLRAPGQSLVAGRLGNGSPVPGGLPPVLERRLRGTAQRSAVKIGPLTAVRYGGKVGGRALTLFVVPTETADVALACSGRTVRQDCWSVAASLRPLGVQAVPPGPDPALEKGLAASLQPLNKAHQRGRAMLVAAVPERSQGAKQLATAASRAAKRLARLTPYQRNRAAVTALRRALLREARAGAAMARAARKRDRADYRRAAGKAERAQAEARAALAALRRTGFSSLPALKRVELPPLPEPAPAPVEYAAVESPSEYVPEASAEAAPSYEAPAPDPEPAPAPSTPSQPVVSAPK